MKEQNIKKCELRRSRTSQRVPIKVANTFQSLVHSNTQSDPLIFTAPKTPRRIPTNFTFQLKDQIPYLNYAE